MIGINDLVQYLKGHIQQNFYPLTFSLNSPDAASQVQFSGGNPVRGDLYQVSVQIITRDTHPATAEQKALEIKQFLNRKSDFLVGDAHVVFVSAQNPFPLYLGTDDNGRYKYSMNYQFLMEV